MKRYCATLERTQRIAIWFDAENDKEADREASRLCDNAKPADFESGTEEYDYALDNVSEGRTVAYWSR